MSKLKFIAALVILLCNTLVHSQKLSLDTIYYKSDYSISERIVFTKDTLKTQSLQTYNVEQPFWKTYKSIPLQELSNNDNIYTLVTNDSKLGMSASIIIQYDDGLISFHTLRRTITSINELEHYKFSELPLGLYMSSDFKSNIDKLKSMEVLSKEDLITCIQFVHSYESIFKAYMQAENLQSFYLFQIAQNLYHLKLYQLGYNPFMLPEEGNYIDKFKNDSDLKSLFKDEHIFQLRMN